MRAVVILLALGLAVDAALLRNPQRIVGGSLTTVKDYSDIVSLLWSRSGSNYQQICGGTIVNHYTILTAAHCVSGDSPQNLCSRVGSSYANSGGTVHCTKSIIVHPEYNRSNLDNDVAILKLNSAIPSNGVARPGSFAGPNYYLGDNEPVYAAGWGATTPGGWGSEQLRHVQIWTVNQQVCRSRYNELRLTVTDNMLCSGWLDVGGRDQCQGDSGGPLYHNGVVVGVCSWGQSCALARFPGVNARVSRYTSWIQANA